jgi:YegS/Rv2252/BmrU family lipid kinase
MTEQNSLKILFIINPKAGNNTINWTTVIRDYFAQKKHIIELYRLPKKANAQTIKEKIAQFLPQRVIAVGGDGTIKLVAECLIETDIALGILPAGSANGLAKELGIDNNPVKALDVLVEGHSKKIHVTLINGQLCIHLSDLGLNAYAMKKFKSQRIRGMWGYLMASLKVLWQNPQMVVEMKIDGQAIQIKAAMIVIANATQYGTGAVINPIGKLDDALFEVIVVKKISTREIFKMVFSHEPYDSDKTEVFQTNALLMQSRKKVHFQIDGEYFGKVQEVKAILIPNALEVIVPAE